MFTYTYLPPFAIFTNNITLSSPSTCWPTQTLSEISDNFSTTESIHKYCSATMNSPMSYNSAVPNRTPLGLSVPSLCIKKMCELYIKMLNDRANTKAQLGQ